MKYSLPALTITAFLLSGSAVFAAPTATDVAAQTAMGTLAVFTFIGYWNSFLWPLLIVSDVNMATVPLGLNMFLGQTGNQWNLLMAAATISVIPSALLVIALQKYLVKGIALSGLGGR